MKENIFEQFYRVSLEEDFDAKLNMIRFNIRICSISNSILLFRNWLIQVMPNLGMRNYCIINVEILRLGKFEYRNQSQSKFRFSFIIVAFYRPQNIIILNIFSHVVTFTLPLSTQKIYVYFIFKYFNIICKKCVLGHVY